jgi:hypothetical protein
MNVRSLVMALGLLSTAACAADMSGVTAINKAMAADLPKFTKAPAYVAPVSCLSAASCSGWYGTFGVSNNADLGGVLTGSANNGIGLNVGGGYQYWQGPIIAGIEFTGGYQFGTAGNTGTATSTQFVKLGYNFFPSTQTGTVATPAASPTAGQNPFLSLVPANILANSTPAVIAGGCYGHGIEKGCLGLEVDSVLAAGWSTAFQYYNAPSVKGQADENVFRIMVQKHL